MSTSLGNESWMPPTHFKLPFSLFLSLSFRRNDYYFSVFPFSHFLIFLFFVITPSLFMSLPSFLAYLMACVYVCLFLPLCAFLHLYPSLLLFGSFPIAPWNTPSTRCFLTSLLPPPSISSSLSPSLSLSIPSRQPPPQPPPPHSLSQPFTPFFCTWDLPNNKWLCPRSDKRSTAQEATATVSFILFFLLSLLTAFELSLQHIIIITEDGNIEIRMQELKWRETERESEREREGGQVRKTIEARRSIGKVY